VIPEDEAWGRDTPERGGREEPFYVVRFRQKTCGPTTPGPTSTSWRPRSPSAGWCRHAEDALGETVYHDFPVHTRSAVVTAHELLDRGVLTEEELRARMDAVRARLTLR
jgi:hypothetical protein